MNNRQNRLYKRLRKFSGKQEIQRVFIESVIDAFFKKYDHKSGSHFKITDDRLKDYPGVTNNDGIYILTVKGKKVKYYHVKELIKLIDYILLQEEEEESTKNLKRE